MHSTLDPKQTNSDNVLVARAEDELARSREQIRQILRANEELSELEHDAARRPSSPQVRVNTRRWPWSLRDLVGLLLEQITQILPANEWLSKPAHDTGRRPSDPQRPWPFHSRPALRGLAGLLLAMGICVSAFAWQRSEPQLVSASSLEKSALTAQPSPPADQAAADAEFSKPAPLAQMPPHDVAPTAAPMSPDLGQLLQTMSRDQSRLNSKN